MLRHPGQDIRHAGPDTLAQALQASRRDTLATFQCWEHWLGQALPTVRAPADLNPPLWELGHVGWFQEYWVGRNPQRHLGAAADPQVRRQRPLHSNADALYDSSRVAHDARWTMRLPDADATRSDLQAQLAATLEWLHAAEPDDRGLYFFRLALLHEDMHHEATLCMAQSLGLPIDEPRWQPAPLASSRHALLLQAGPWRLGQAGGGFSFDNELGAHEVALAACDIDSRVLCWDEYLPFVEEGGYGEERWWDEPGRRWLRSTRPAGPRFLRREGRSWQQWRWGRWQPLDLRLPACHLNRHEAQAWCAWAGRRLPTEAEWEAAALEWPCDFEWGSVWEWTASAFKPYPGFAPHPYRDYSAPWFGQRAVLRGASFATAGRLHHPRYRNFFESGRQDVFAGFRTCSH
ncbi:selenoneine synthase SenA [Azohydromonas caseinilytica]|uniref:Ergothioneine biosynthesis protein EgtB n=1 Tax=Azohydromonas caseinilytica TaxID=2728836 RepID=A0A848FED0_9BURK|nr:selenoneine synthase SenA [Azohydromonas caseinilytica]NML18567.1 ergothioneine biosynthesis protein EgtB [Azohydromonas caseinilytica]